MHLLWLSISKVSSETCKEYKTDHKNFAIKKRKQLKKLLSALRANVPQNHLPFDLEMLYTLSHPGLFSVN